MPNNAVLPAHVASAVRLVTDGLASPHSRRAYARAVVAFLAWWDAEHHPPLSRAVVTRYVAFLRDQRGLAPASVNQAVAAIRRLVDEGASAGWCDDATALAVRRVPGMRSHGQRMGRWLSADEAQAVLDAPPTATLTGVRDRAALALLLGCGLRRDEARRVTVADVQRRAGRWVIVDLLGKGRKLRGVPMPLWAKRRLDDWWRAAAITSGPALRSVDRHGHVAALCLSGDALHRLVAQAGRNAGVGDLAPHDLRRTFAQLARAGGAQLEQIQVTLGHASVQTTERYLGTRLDLHDAACDRLGIGA